MKILKNLLLIVFTVAFFASCEKSNVTPGKKCGEASVQSPDPSTEPTDNSQSKGRAASTDETPYYPEDENNLLADPTDEDPLPYGVSGSGDDDRDGGDRRKKR